MADSMSDELFEEDNTVDFADTTLSLSETLAQLAASIEGETITVRELLALAGEQGLLLGMMILTIPFLVPISIPGVSTVFSLVGLLMAASITLNRLPWLPDFLLDRTLDAQKMRQAFERGESLMQRIDRFTHPRVTGLTEGRTMNLVNGLALIYGNILLLFPFGFVPFSNTLPAWALLMLSAGMLQRDGVLILLGYLLLIATTIYFGVLIAGALAAGHGLLGLIGG
ncbi:MAG: exopolysaccharide biosynthesis protein [Candidatus Promineifilaceae bacterium]|jgi:hypothetical protein